MKKVKSELQFLAIAVLAMAAISAWGPVASLPAHRRASSGPQPIGGYVSSDSVAADALVAYYPFDNNSNDAKGGLTATTVGATFVTGNSWPGIPGCCGCLCNRTSRPCFRQPEKFFRVCLVFFSCPTG